MVEQIVSFKPKLHVHVFAKGRLLVNGEVKLPEVRADEGIASLVSEMHGVDAIWPDAQCCAVGSGRRVDEDAILCRSPSAIEGAGNRE